MEKLQKTKAIVLSTKEWREDDLLFSFLTEEFGRIQAIATGSKKTTSKLVGHLSAPGIVELIFVQGKAQKKITHAYLIKTFKLNKADDFYFLNIAWEIIDKAVLEETAYSEVWQLIGWLSINITNYQIFEQKRFIVNIFLIKLLNLLGFRINLEKQRKNFNPKTAQIINQLQNEQFGSGFSISKNDNKALFNFLQRYLQYNLEQSFNSFRIVGSLDKSIKLA